PGSWFTASRIIQPHRFPDVAHGFLRQPVGSLTSVRNDIAYQRRVFFVHSRTLMHGLLLREYCIDNWLLAFKAADACGRTTLLHPLPGFRIRINEMKLPQRTLGRIAGVAAPDTCRIGRHCPYLLYDAGFILSQIYGVIV